MARAPLNPGTARKVPVQSTSGPCRCTFDPCHVSPSLCKRGPGEIGTSCGAQLASVIGEPPSELTAGLWRELPFSSAKEGAFFFLSLLLRQTGPVRSRQNQREMSVSSEAVADQIEDAELTRGKVWAPTLRGSFNIWCGTGVLFVFALTHATGTRH